MKTGVRVNLPDRKNYKRIRPWIFYLILFGLAVVFRLVLVLLYQHAVSFDEAHYLRLAGSFLERGPAGLLHPYWPPLFPLLIAVSQTLFRNLEWAGRLLNMIAGSALVLMIPRFSRALFGDAAARITGLFIAFYPPLALSQTNVMPETLYSVAGIGGILLAWRAIERRRFGPALTAGLVWGMAYLLKPEGVGFLIVFSGVFLVIQLFNHSRRRWMAALIVCTGFAVVAGPYLGYLRHTMGKWTLSSKGDVDQQLSAAVMFDEGEIKDPFYHLTADNQSLPYDMAYHYGNLQELKQHGEGESRVVRLSAGHYIRKYGINFYDLVKYAIPRVFTFSILILAALGFFSAVNRQGRFIFFYLLCHFLFFWFLVVPLFHVNDRYLAPLFPLVFIWAGQGCRIMAIWIRERMAESGRIMRRISGDRAGLILVTAFVLVFSVIPESAKIMMTPRYDPGIWAQPVGLKKAGLWLRTQTEGPPVLMSLNKAVDFYAGQYDMKKGASFSYDSIRRNLAYARNRHVQYLVFSERYLEWFPNLRPLIDGSDLPDGIDLIYTDTDPAGIRTVIYKLKNENHTGEGR